MKLSKKDKICIVLSIIAFIFAVISRIIEIQNAKAGAITNLEAAINIGCMILIVLLLIPVLKHIYQYLKEYAETE